MLAMTQHTPTGEELRPCPVPWCASTNVEVEQFICIFKTGQHKDAAVVCQDCNFGSPVRCTEAEARELWNRRPTPEDAPQQGEVTQADIAARKSLAHEMARIIREKGIGAVAESATAEAMDKAFRNHRLAATPPPVAASEPVAEILSAIINASRVGKPGTAPLKSKWATYPSALYHRAVAALSRQPKGEG